MLIRTFPRSDGISSRSVDALSRLRLPTKAELQLVIGTLKAKLAKYRHQLLEPDKKGPKGEGFDVMKSGGKQGVGNMILWLRCTDHSLSKMLVSP